MLEYLKERRDGEIWRVEAPGVITRQPIKCKDQVLENSIERRDGEEC